MKGPRTLHCYAFGRVGDWEAICVDLDLSVQGASFEEVFQSLGKATTLYINSLRDLPEADQNRLLYRPAPLSVRLKFLGHALASLLTIRPDRFHHQFTMPLAA